MARDGKFKISKSQFIKGDQCEKALWLYRERPELKPPITEEQQKIFDKGHMVGELATNLFPGGIEVIVENLNMEEAERLTREYIENGKEIIYEATAVNSDGIYSRIDILEKAGDTWNLIEVKSSTSKKEYHIKDMAVQRLAFEGAGFKIDRSYLIHLKKGQYFKVTKSSNHEEVFEKVDCTPEVLNMIEKVSTKTGDLLELVQQTEEPNKEMGSHCDSPFECEYKEYCRSLK
ncbi:MAG: Dna2/Cas4 domain-containing protein [Bacteriovoracaceae bacterium]|nr:Dna2/Cas4 domain-containing protein [Bacteriovoracaceae bacterium]